MIRTDVFLIVIVQQERYVYLILGEGISAGVKLPPHAVIIAGLTIFGLAWVVHF